MCEHLMIKSSLDPWGVGHRSLPQWSSVVKPRSHFLIKTTLSSASWLLSESLHPSQNSLPVVCVCVRVCVRSCVCSLFCRIAKIKHFLCYLLKAVINQ